MFYACIFGPNILRISDQTIQSNLSFQPLNTPNPIDSQENQDKKCKRNQNKIWFGFVELVYGILLWSLEL